MKPKIGIADDVLDNVIHLLSVDLANEMTLYVKTRKAHIGMCLVRVLWNCINCSRITIKN
jgi:hypothetical protein